MQKQAQQEEVIVTSTIQINKSDDEDEQKIQEPQFNSNVNSPQTSQMKFHKTNKKKKLTQQDIQKARDKREEWYLDLQQIFDQINEAVNTILMEKSQIDVSSLQINKEFQKKVKKEMKETENIINSLNKVNDPLIKQSDSEMLIHSFKQSLQELLKLMQVIKTIDQQQVKLTKMKFETQRQNRCQDLLNEIKFSTRRVQRIKAGNRLDKVLEEQLVKLKIDPITQKEQWKVLQTNFVKNQSPKKPSKQLTDHNLKSKATEEETIETHANDQEDLKLKNDSLKTSLQQFKNRKDQLEKMIEQYSMNNNCKLEYKSKYQHIFNYFQNRYNLISMYVGENLILDFIQQRTDEANQKFIKGYQTNILRRLSMEKFKELETNNGDNNGHQDDHNVTAINKIGTINDQIKKQLLQEEYDKKMEQITILQNQENQKYWQGILDQLDQLQKTTPDFVYRRPFKKKNLENDSQQFQHQNNKINQAKLPRHQTFYNNKYGSYYANASPSNSIINTLFKDEKFQKKCYSNINDAVIKMEGGQYITPNTSQTKRLQQCRSLTSRESQDQFPQTFYENLFYKCKLNNQRIKFPSMHTREQQQNLENLKVIIPQKKVQSEVNQEKDYSKPLYINKHNSLRLSIKKPKSQASTAFNTPRQQILQQPISQQNSQIYQGIELDLQQDIDLLQFLNKNTDGNPDSSTNSLTQINLHKNSLNNDLLFKINGLYWMNKL